jgi:hypothetical protein
MKTLFDLFKFNNMPYAEVTDKAGKIEIEKWVSKLEGTDIGKRLLKDYSNGHINIKVFNWHTIENPQLLITDIPEDLMPKVIAAING